MSRTIGDRAWPRVLDLKPREPPVETVTRMLPWELQCKASSPVTDLEIRTSPVKVLGRGSDKINISEMGGILRKNRSSILRQFSKHINHLTLISIILLSLIPDDGETVGGPDTEEWRAGVQPAGQGWRGGGQGGSRPPVPAEQEGLRAGPLCGGSSRKPAASTGMEGIAEAAPGWQVVI